MENKLNAGPQASPGAVLGALLVVAGVLFLAVRLAPFDLGQYGWPVFVIGAGVALLVIGLISPSSVGLVVPGSIVMVVGLILAVQNAFGLWASWSYAWALVFPGSVGMGIAIMGLARRNRAQATQGGWMAFTGLVLFALFATFFEGLFRVNGLDLGVVGTIVFPVFLIVIGLALLFARLFRRQGA